MRSSTVLVIPAYSECGRVGDVVRAVRKLHPELDVLVVDDGSPDDTAAEAQRAGARVLKHPFNMGYGTALHSGYCAALRGGYERVLQMDADGQHDPAMLGKLIAELDRGADIALGSRYIAGDQPRSSLARRVGTRCFSWIASRWIGSPTRPAASRGSLAERWTRS